MKYSWTRLFLFAVCGSTLIANAKANVLIDGQGPASPAPPGLSAFFSLQSLQVGQSTTLTFTITNSNVTTLSAIQFTDTLRLGLTIATPNALSSTCGGSTQATSASSLITLSNAAIADNSSCTLSLQVLGVSPGIQNNLTSAVSSSAGSGAAASANLTVLPLAAPVLSPFFSAATLPLNGTTVLAIGIVNDNLVGLTGLGFTDTLPNGLQVGPSGVISNTCGGTATASAGSGVFTFASGVTPAQQVCYLNVSVVGVAPGVQKDVTSTVTSNEAGPGQAAAASLIVIAPPTIATSFGANTIPVNGNATLTFQVSNPNATPLTGIGFTDTLPGSLQITSATAVTNTCSGNLAALAGSSALTFTNGTLAAGATCSIAFNITAPIAGMKANQTSVISSNEGGSGPPASASIMVDSSPALSLTFGSAAIPLNGTTTLAFLLSNANATSLTGISFSDNLPAGLQIAATSGLTNSCGGTVSAVAGAGTVSFSGGSIAASGACSLQVNVSASKLGTLNDVTSTVASNEGGVGPSAAAAINVLGPPMLAETFGPTSIPLNGTSFLTFTITNPNAFALTGLSFSDNLPSGMQVATAGTLSNTCNGAVIAAPGAGSIAFSGGNIPPTASCSLAVNVTGLTLGSKTNTTSAITSIEGGTGLAAFANMLVIAPPAFIQKFVSTSIPLNGKTGLSFQITNPNASALTGLSFTDNLPPGLQVATNPAATNTCQGSIAAAGNATSVNLSGGILPANASCTVSLIITGIAAGVQSNTSSPISSNEGGTGTGATATLGVIAPPSITAAFGAASIPLNGAIPFTVTIANANSSGLTGVGFSNQLPSGLVVANPNAITSNCTGTLSAVSGSTLITLGGATLSAGGNCFLIIDVVGVSGGLQSDSTSAIASNEGGIGNIATASLIVVAHPSITSAFAVGALALNSSTTLSFQIANPTSIAQTGLAFTDQLPAGLQVATPNGITNNCGGTVAAVSNQSALAFSHGSVSPNSQCMIAVNVTATTLGTKSNFTSAVTSNEGGIGDSASATLTVDSAPALAIAFGAPAMPLSGTTTLNFQISNPNGFALTGLTFTDTLPAGLQLVSTSATANSCGGVLQAVAASSNINLASGLLPAGGTCNIVLSVSASSSGAKNNVTSEIASNEAGVGNTASANLNVVAPPAIASNFTPGSIPLNGTTTVGFQITNPNKTPLTGVSLSDALPNGLLVANPNGLANTCGGVITPASGSSNIALSGAAIGSNGSCSIAVALQGTVSGLKSNTTSAVNSIEGGVGNTVTAAMNVIGPPGITASFTPGSVIPSGATTLTVYLSNTNASALSGVAFTNTLPAGFLIATPNQLSNTCGGTVLATSATNLLSLTAAKLSANGACRIAIRVTAAGEGEYSDTSTAVQSVEGGPGNSATASIVVASPPTITMKFPIIATPLGNSVQLTYTVTNPNQSQLLTGITFTNALPNGLQIAAPNGLVGTCGQGTVTAAPGTQTVTLVGASLSANNSSCNFSVNLTPNITGQFVNTVASIISDQTIAGPASSATLTIGSVFAVSYAAHLDSGDSVINITNIGENGASLYGPGFGPATGNLCVNVYALAATEQLISCCSCLVAPGELASLSINKDLLSNSATGVSPTSVIVDLVATLAGSTGASTSCNNTAALPGILASGIEAWSTTLNTAPAPQPFSLNELPFSPASLSAAQLASLNNRCAQIIGNNGGLGICQSCRVGGRGGIASPL